MSEKKCTKCKAVKPFSEFYKHSQCKGGMTPKCKACISASNLIRRRNKDGLLRQIYDGQLHGSKKRNHPLPDYTRSEFIEWALKHEKFHQLFDDWVKSGYEKIMSPSADRINDYDHYHFGNIQLMTWGENSKKAYADRRNGVNNKVSKTVMQLSLNGCFLTEHHSAHHASRTTECNRSNISSCCRGKIKTAGGYIWMFAEDYLPTN